MEMAAVLEEAPFTLTTKVTVISSASYLGLYAITQLDNIKATFLRVFIFLLLYSLSLLSLLECFLSKFFA